MSKRLIERHLPIGAISEESVRERRSMTALPPIYYLHVWWARRPLVASRAAILGSLLPDTIEDSAFLHALGIHGDPVAAKQRIDIADRKGERLGPNAYGYARAFSYNPTRGEMAAILPNAASVRVLDPTAGGGAIPFEAFRLGLDTLANDLNPVASIIEKATIEYPAYFGLELPQDIAKVGAEFSRRLRERIAPFFPAEQGNDHRPDGYLWARTISCPYCEGTIPLSPNWRLTPTGVGIRLKPTLANGPGSVGRTCKFEIVRSADEQSEATVSGGDALCPFPDCGRAVDGDEVKKQAQSVGMGDQLFAVVIKKKMNTVTKGGKAKVAWVRDYRAPVDEDDVSNQVAIHLMEKMEEWIATDTIPSENIDIISNYDRGHRMYGMQKWTDLFSARQLLMHGYSCEIYRELLAEDVAASALTDIRKATYVYISFALDKLRDYNSRMTRWIVQREVMANTFDSHNFAVKWSYCEMAPMVEGLGPDWAIKQMAKCVKELTNLVGIKRQSEFLDDEQNKGKITISNGSGSDLSLIEDKSVDAVVMDPPYGANVMYAELSDFFYVWLKRTAGLVVPQLFTRAVADKTSEAVANKALFKEQKNSGALANSDYQLKMSSIFAECRRVLKDDGIMTVMFTHKDTGAWDALAMSLMDAGFVITASWPVNTEASGSLHIKDKAAANSTIFLVCRPREDAKGEAVYWEDVEPEVARAVRARVGEYQTAGIAGVDLYLASFGPALEAFSRHWPLTRGTPAPEPKRKRRTQSDMFEVFDPYAVRPEDALNAARREVKAWRLAQLASTKAQADMDGPTAFYVLAWDAFKAVSFPYDEALRLARAVGVDLDDQVVGRLGEKKGSEIKLWDSATRIAKGAIGPVDGTRGMIDALHHAAHAVRGRGVEAAVELLEKAGIGREDEFKVAMEALLEVLPPSKTFSGIESDKAVKPAADDFDALEKLRRIAYENEIGEPQQLELYREMMEADPA